MVSAPFRVAILVTTKDAAEEAIGQSKPANNWTAIPVCCQGSKHQTQFQELLAKCVFDGKTQESYSLSNSQLATLDHRNNEKNTRVNNRQEWHNGGTQNCITWESSSGMTN